MRRAAWALAPLLLLSAVAAVVPVPAAVDPLAGAGPDSAEVARFLRGLHASDPLICALATELLGTRIDWHNDDEGIALLRDAPPAAAGMRIGMGRPVTDPAGIGLLVPELEGRNACVRRAAAALLGESGRPEAMAALRTGLTNHEGRVREAAAFGLGVAGDSADLPRLRSRLDDRDPDVVRLAAWALGVMQDRAAETALVALLKHPHPGVRRTSAWALGRI